MPKVYKNIRELQRAFRKNAKNLLTKQDMHDFASIQVRHRKAGFETGTDPDGNQWAPLKDSTIERKRRKGSSSPEKILVDKGYLAKTAPIEATEKYAKIPVAKSRVDVLDYHEQGNENLPQRKSWGFYKDAIRDINKLFIKRLFKRFKQLGD